ncbi:hypothetical protein PF008_g31102 [Phytophthora fragariae]|uniref:Uncharacterized protein n=1 Tax=Phytophthora fragariae TaxID=53985 RepID=A0A6G0Q3L0_9STRA|nr:hypothetical protein PF008_g31102 [Phytophthora fragariae]
MVKSSCESGVAGTTSSLNAWRLGPGVVAVAVSLSPSSWLGRMSALGYYGTLMEAIDSDEEAEPDCAVAAETTRATPPQSNLDCSESYVDMAQVERQVQDTSTDQPGVERTQRGGATHRKGGEQKRAGSPATNLDIKQLSMGSMADKTGKLINSATALKERRRKHHDANRTGLGTLRLHSEGKAGLVQTSIARYIQPFASPAWGLCLARSPRRSCP